MQLFFNVFALDGGSDDLCLTEGIYKSFPKLFCGFEPSAQIGKSGALGLRFCAASCADTRTSGQPRELQLRVASAGREVVEQSLLQSCIFEVTKRTDPSIPQSEFSERFWQTQSQMADKEKGCHMGGVVREFATKRKKGARPEPSSLWLQGLDEI